MWQLLLSVTLESLLFTGSTLSATSLSPHRNGWFSCLTSPLITPRSYYFRASMCLSVNLGLLLKTKCPACIRRKLGTLLIRQTLPAKFSKEAARGQVWQPPAICYQPQHSVADPASSTECSKYTSSLLILVCASVCYCLHTSSTRHHPLQPLKAYVYVSI